MVVFGVASYGVAIDSTHATNHGREAGLTKLDQIAVDSRLIPVADYQAVWLTQTALAAP